MLIYKALNTKNNKVYIGKTEKTLEERKLNHFYESHQKRRTSYFYNALRKNKKNFVWEVVEDNISDSTTLNEKEIFWIAHFKSTQKEFGYNMTDGGTGGNINGNHPNKKEIYKRVGIKLKGRKRKSFYKEWVEKLGQTEADKKWKIYLRFMAQRVSEESTGKPKSKSHLAKVRKALKGVPQSSLAKFRKTKKGRELSREVKQNIRLLFEQGETVNFIRLKLGYSHGKITKELKLMGLL